MRPSRPRLRRPFRPAPEALERLLLLDASRALQPLHAAMSDPGALLGMVPHGPIGGAESAARLARLESIAASPPVRPYETVIGPLPPSQTWRSLLPLSLAPTVGSGRPDALAAVMDSGPGQVTAGAPDDGGGSGPYSGGSGGTGPYSGGSGGTGPYSGGSGGTGPYSGGSGGTGTGTGGDPTVAGEVTLIGEDNGSTVKDTIAYTPGPGGVGGSYDSTLTYSYGDGANGGSGSIEYNITATSSGITFSLIVATQDAYDRTVTLTGPGNGGSLADSGSDSFKLNDQLTLNDDGTASDTYSSDTANQDKFKMAMAGSDSTGGSFNIADGGDDDASYHDAGKDNADGSGTDAYTASDTSNDTRTFSDSAAGGATASDSQTDKLTYSDGGGSSSGAGGSSPTSNDTANGTDTGKDSSTYNGSGPIDGGSYTTAGSNSDTYNDSETLTKNSSGGVPTVSENLDDAGTSNNHSAISVTGVADPNPGDGSGSGYGSGSGSGSGSGGGGPSPNGTTDSLTETSDGNRTYDDKTVKTPDGSGTDETDTEDSTSHSSGSNSGSTPAGAFSSGGSGDTSDDLTVTTTPTGTTVSDTQTTSPPNGTSTGSFPTGTINQDAMYALYLASHGADSAEGDAATQAAQNAGTVAPTPGAPGTGAPAPAPPAAPTPAAPAVPPPPPLGTTSGPNEVKALPDYLADLVGIDADYKSRVFSKKQTTLYNNGMNPNPNLRLGVDRGQYMIVPKLPPGRTLGSKGAAPCIGVIIADPTGRVCCYHFDGGDKPAGTMLMTNPGKYPKGTRALIFGGDNTDVSNFTLFSVVSYLETNQVEYSYSNTTGGNVDSNGKFFLYKVEGMKP